jgi:hypothetical protein
MNRILRRLKVWQKLGVIIGTFILFGDPGILHFPTDQMELYPSVT